MFNKIKTRIRNPKVAIAIVSGVLMILVNLDVIDASMSAKVTEIANYVLGFGVTLGIFGNPESHVSSEDSAE